MKKKVLMLATAATLALAMVAFAEKP